MKIAPDSIIRSARVRLVLTIIVFLLFWTLIAFLLHPGPINLNPVNFIPGGPRSSPLFLILMGVLEKYIALDTLARLSILFIGFILAWRVAIHFLSDIQDITNLRVASNALGVQVYGFGRNSDQVNNRSQSNSLEIAQTDPDLPLEFSMDCTCRSKDGIRIKLSGISVKANPTQISTVKPLFLSIVKTIVRTGLNKYYRSRHILEILKKNESANYEKKPFPIEVFPEIFHLSPELNQLPSHSSVKYKAVYIPEVNFQQNTYTFDLATPAILYLNQEFQQSEKELGLLIQIIGIEKWECLPAIANKDLEQIWEIISSPVILDRPEKISDRKQQIEHNLCLEHLDQIKKILTNPEDPKPLITTLLFYYEFFQRKLEDFRFESEPIPTSLASLVSTLEDRINSELINEGTTNESK